MPLGSQTIQQSRLFASAKTMGAVPVPSRVIHDFLIQATLDPSVSSIRFVRTIHVVAKDAIKVNSLLMRRNQCLLAVFDKSSPEDRNLLSKLIELGIKPLAVRKDDILREPRLTNTRTVWQHRKRCVPVHLRMKIALMLQATEVITVGALLSSLKQPQHGELSILSLACSNFLYLNLDSHPLGFKTIVSAHASY
jgi:hypothetical protein